MLSRPEGPMKSPILGRLYIVRLCYVQYHLRHHHVLRSSMARLLSEGPPHRREDDHGVTGGTARAIPKEVHLGRCRRSKRRSKRVYTLLMSPYI